MRERIELAAKGIEALAVLIIVGGIAYSILRYLLAGKQDAGGANRQFKNRIGNSLLLGLEFPMDASTRFSFERTLLSHERTVMSWVRTATSLITFGFTLYKFFELDPGTAARPRAQHVISARTFAMVMIASGLFSLLVAAIQNWQYRGCWRKQGLRVAPSLSTLVGGRGGRPGAVGVVRGVGRWWT